MARACRGREILLGERNRRRGCTNWKYGRFFQARDPLAIQLPLRLKTS